MLQDEKDQLIAFFEPETNWCRGHDAIDDEGLVVHYDDENAVAWDLVGGICHLFGWKRACGLFEPMSRHVAKRRHRATAFERDTEMAAMASLLDFNDDDETTHAILMERLRALPVWRGESKPREIVETDPETHS